MAANAMANTKAELISGLVQKELLESASLVQFLTDYSSLAVKGVSSVSIPKMASFTVADRAFGAAASENAALADTKDTIALDKNKIILFGYDAADAVQSSIEYKIVAAQRAASAHGRQVNTDIITMWESVAGLNINTSTPADITVADILDMKEFMQVNFADMTKVAFVIAADQEKAMLKLPEFSRYDYRGGGSAPVVNGLLGFVYGIPVVLNQQIKAQQAFMVEKSGSGIAFQRNAKMAEESALVYGTDGKRVAVDQLYGVGGLLIAEGSAAAGKSPLIAKLID